MKPLASTMTEFDTLPGEETQFGISDPRWVMRSLADLYSNRELAVIREYSTNAWDAHVMGNCTDVPIEVTLPTTVDPYFRVWDWGVGMTKETLQNRYTQFGDSDKRDRNDANGTMGFGCKSAVAYTTQFTVTSVKDGFKTIAVITRKPDFSIVLKVVSHSKANASERNGTLVEIPVSDIPKFNHMAGDFYKFWHKGTVKVNGEFPEQAVGEKIEDHLFYSANRGTSYVVMGNVAYRIANPDFLFRQKNINPISFVAYVDHLSDDGGPAVEHTPSREDLKYTNRTNATLNTVIGGFITKMMEQAKKELSKATTYYDAYVIYMEWADRLGRGVLNDLMFKGEKFQDSFEIKGQRYTYGQRQYGTRRIEDFRVSEAENTVFIIDFQHILNAGHKAKAYQWSRLDGNPRVNRFVFTEEKSLSSKWVNPKNVVKWDTLKAAIPKPSRDPLSANYTGPRRPKGTFDYWTSKGHFTEKPLPDTGRIMYITVQDSKSVDVQSALRLLDWDATTVIKLASNRIEKFCRDNKTVSEFLPVAKTKVVKDGKSLLSDDAKTVLAIGYQTRQWLDLIDPSKVDDPEWKRMHTLLKTPDLMKKYEDNRTLAHYLNMRYDVKEHGINSDNNGLLVKYRLLELLSTYQRRGVVDEVVIYLNAAYKAKKGN